MILVPAKDLLATWVADTGRNPGVCSNLRSLDLGRDIVYQPDVAQP
jgi:hypothetical protein